MIVWNWLIFSMKCLQTPDCRSREERSEKSKLVISLTEINCQNHLIIFFVVVEQRGNQRENDGERDQIDDQVEKDDVTAFMHFEIGLETVQMVTIC